MQPAGSGQLCMADASMDSGTAAPAGVVAADAEARSGPERNSEPQITAPAPKMAAPTQNPVV